MRVFDVTDHAISFTVDSSSFCLIFALFQHNIFSDPHLMFGSKVEEREQF